MPHRHHRNPFHAIERALDRHPTVHRELERVLHAAERSPALQHVIASHPSVKRAIHLADKGRSAFDALKAHTPLVKALIDHYGPEFSKVIHHPSVVKALVHNDAVVKAAEHLVSRADDLAHGAHIAQNVAHEFHELSKHPDAAHVERIAAEIAPLIKGHPSLESGLHTAMDIVHHVDDPRTKALFKDVTSLVKNPTVDSALRLASKHGVARDLVHSAQLRRLAHAARRGLKAHKAISRAHGKLLASDISSDLKHAALAVARDHVGDKLANVIHDASRDIKKALPIATDLYIAATRGDTAPLQALDPHSKLLRDALTGVRFASMAGGQLINTGRAILKGNPKAIEKSLVALGEQGTQFIEDGGITPAQEKFTQLYASDPRAALICASKSLLADVANEATSLAADATVASANPGVVAATKAAVAVGQQELTDRLKKCQE